MSCIFLDPVTQNDPMPNQSKFPNSPLPLASFVLCYARSTMLSLGRLIGTVPAPTSTSKKECLAPTVDRVETPAGSVGTLFLYI